MKPPNESPSSNEFGQLRSLLAKQKWKQAQINEVIGTSSQGKSRLSIANLIRSWLSKLVG